MSIAARCRKCGYMGCNNDNSLCNNKQFTGDRKIYVACLNHLLEKGFVVDDATHIGDNRYEFREHFFSDKMGYRDIHAILAWVEESGVKYKTKVIGFCFTD